MDSATLETTVYEAAWSGSPPPEPSETERCEHDMIQDYCAWCHPPQTS